MKELMILTFGAAQSVLIWVILRLRDKANALEEENDVLAKIMLQWIKEDKNDN